MSETTPKEVRNSILHMLRRDLIGPLPPTYDGEPGPDADLQRERLAENPAAWYLTGYIAPAGEVTRAVDQDDDPDNAEERETTQGDFLDDDMDAREDDDRGAVAQDDPPPEAPTVRRRFTPASIGITTILPADIRRIDVRVTWGDYTTEPPLEMDVLAEDAQKAVPEVEWLRRPGDENITIDVPLNGKGEEKPIPGSAAPLMPGSSLVLQAHARPFRITPPGEVPQDVRVVTVFLINRRQTARKRVADVTYAFQVRLELHCPRGFIPRADASSYHSDDFDLRLADLHYSDVVEYAVGRNVSAAWQADTDDVVRRVWTEPLPTAEVERVAPNEDEEVREAVTFGMDALAKSAEAGPGGIDEALAALPQLYDAWINDQPEALDNLAERRREVGQQLTDDMRRALKRIESGIDRLRTDDRARLAFRIANLAISSALKKRNPERGEPTWRPFQLAFILLNLDGLSERGHEDREFVDLLFFPTGGGKTEAYLGLAAYTIAYRRLRNMGILGAGVSVIMRYTLRLLTLDQLGRAAGMICALELLRNDERYLDANGRRLLGDWPIEIGLWVGSDASPNYLGGLRNTGDHTAVTRVRRFRQRPEKAAKPAPIKACPWCNTPFDGHSFDCKPNFNVPKRMVMSCANTDCEFARTPLPVLAVDEEIYRRLPAFVVATVDKFAGLPWLGEAGAFFGHVDRQDDDGFYGAATPNKGRALDNDNCLEPPDLVIQDELHLISGPLGTVAGLYEAAIDQLTSRQEGGKRVRMKIVASTATVRRASAQIEALFDRQETRIFPPPGVDRRDSWFAKTVPSDDEPARLYVGLAAQGRGPKFVFLRGLRTIMAAAWAEFERHGGHTNGKNPADPYVTAVCYFNALRELGGARRIVEDEVRTQLVSYAESRQRIDPPGQVFPNRVLRDPLELTSRVSTDDVAKAKGRLDLLFNSEDADVVDVAMATNMISVGLDITRLGLMMVQGQPKAAAEYIQATSRVGRDASKPGLVVTALNLHKPRDRGHYEAFSTYHSSFYRAVEATSVTPWAARALDRSLAAVIVAIARHLRPELSPETAAREIDEIDVRDEIVNVLLARAPENAIVGGRAALEQEIDKVIKTWLDRADLHKSDLVFGDRKRRGKKYLLYQPLDPVKPPPGEEVIEAGRSMRDVEGSVVLRIRDPNGSKFRAEDVA